MGIILAQAVGPPLPPVAGAQHRYLRPEDTRAIRDLEFHPRRMTHGTFAGQHQSPQRGQGSDFSDYREYTPGDEIKHLDWKVLGRSDRLYVKTFEHQAQMTVNLLIDASASMAYGRRRAAPAVRSLAATRPPPDGGKYDYACRLAAAIGYLVIRRQDRVGLGFARRGLIEYTPPRGTMPHLFELVARMEMLNPMYTSDLAGAYREMVLRHRRRAVLLLFSDFMEDDEDAVLRELRIARHRGHDVVLFHVLHPHELHLPDLGEAVLQDSEQPSRRVRFHAPDLREAYADRLAEYLRRWHESSLTLGIDHQLAPISRPIPELLREFLTLRARRR